VSDNNSNEIVIRKPLIKDVPAMAHIINGFATQGLMLPRSRHQVYKTLCEFVVATSNGAIVGCAALDIVWEDLGEIRSLAVAEEWQRHGVGRLLVEALLDEAKALGLPGVFALTYQEPFFEGMGFHVVPRESLPHKIWGDCLNCPKYPDCDEIAMKLRFEKEENHEG